MNKKTRILFLFTICLTLLSITALFYKTIILQDFDLVTIYEEDAVTQE